MAYIRHQGEEVIGGQGKFVTANLCLTLEVKKKEEEDENTKERKRRRGRN